jgi:hypothetical protein
MDNKVVVLHNANSAIGKGAAEANKGASDSDSVSESDSAAETEATVAASAWETAKGV